MKIIFNCFILLALALFFGCSDCIAQEIEELNDLFLIESIPQEKAEIYDPFEQINRKIFNLNIKIIEKTRESAKKGLFGSRPSKNKKETQKFLLAIKSGIFNFLDNLSETSNAINFALQGNPQDSFKSAWRFFLNSSIGFLGFLDVADLLELKKERASFEQTLIKYGAGPGPYIVAPILGAYSLRRATADILEVIFNPLFFLIDNKFVVFVIYDYNVVSRYFDYYDIVFKDNVDSYAKVRSLYLQNPIF